MTLVPYGTIRKRGGEGWGWNPKPSHNSLGFFFYSTGLYYPVCSKWMMASLIMNSAHFKTPADLLLFKEDLLRDMRTGYGPHTKERGLF